MKNICVYCSSSTALSPLYTDLAKELGHAIAAEGYTLVYGGANIGLMGDIASAVKEAKGAVVGVIPELFHRRSLSFERADDLIITSDLRERKARMIDMAHAFVALPGGYGTLEEIMEVLTLKQLGLIRAPVVFINAENFYDDLFSLFDTMARKKFMKEEYHSLYHVSEDAGGAMDYIKSYVHVELPSKWF